MDRLRKTCKVCGKRRKPPSKKLYRLHWEADPYCSRPCAEADRGVVWNVGSSVPIGSERITAWKEDAA